MTTVEAPSTDLHAGPSPAYGAPAPEQLPGVTDQRSAESWATLIAMQRWESDGGAVHFAYR